MHIMTWNCQGAASRELMRVFKNFLHQFKVDIVAILEPRISGFQANKVCERTRFDKWVRVEAFGFSGGIWVLWKGHIQIEVVATNTQFIVVRVEDNMRCSWHCSFVYGSPDSGLRQRLWQKLDRVALQVDGAWLTVGDFNSVLSPDEVNTPENWNAHKSASFQEWIFEQGLVGLGFHGSKFTWFRGVQEATFKGARLDRALSNVD